jgi:hypothetical protein
MYIGNSGDLKDDKKDNLLLKIMLFIQLKLAPVYQLVATGGNFPSHTFLK